jgi:hypothetical protein
MGNPIDVTIYMQKLDESETINELINEVSEKEEIRDKAKLKETFLNKMEMKALENFAEFEDPILNEEQFNSSLIEALVEVTLDELMAMGLVMADFDPEKGENVYDLTPEHRKRMEEDGGE